MNNNPNKNLQPVYYSLILLIGLFLGYQLSNKTGGSFFQSGSSNTLQEISTLIKSKYVDDVNLDSITENTIETLLAGLDPHSIYIPLKELEAINNQLEGQYTGIGIMYEIIDDTVTITQLVDGGAAKKVGIEVGDKMLFINDSVSLTHKKLTADFIKSKMQGKAGSSINVSVLRDNKLLKFNAIRSAIQIPSVDVGYMLDDKNGYVKINKFADRTYEEFMVQLEKLQKAKMQNLIIDLRGNGGGYMHAATGIADEFLDGDKLIVYTQGKKREKDEKRCKKEGLFETGKLIVLIDETSASASEVLAGALQDWDRATIIGRRSFGKGLVQEQYNLGNGGALRLTTARYYTPLGRNIQKSYKNGVEKYREEVLERYKDGEVFTKDSIIDKENNYKTPKGKVVYGGGGIMPDIFVAIDTSFNVKDFYRIVNSAGFNKFQLQYYQQHKTQINNSKNIDELRNYVVLSENDKNYIKSLVLKDSIKLNTNISDYISSKLEQSLLADFCKIKFGNEAFFSITNKDDSVILKSIEILNSKN